MNKNSKPRKKNDFEKVLYNSFFFSMVLTLIEGLIGDYFITYSSLTRASIIIVISMLFLFVNLQLKSKLDYIFIKDIKLWSIIYIAMAFLAITISIKGYVENTSIFFERGELKDSIIFPQLGILFTYLGVTLALEHKNSKPKNK